MAVLEGGTFAMGTRPAQARRVARQWRHCGVEERWISKESPQHAVSVPTFKLMRYPVTNQDWLLYRTEVASAGVPSSWALGVYPHDRANHPAWTVSEAQADGYARWLSVRTGRNFRLPTEAEWEYAATGGDGREYPWGDLWDPQKANTAEAGPLITTPIGMYPSGRSPSGLCDMAGNVEEYVADSYEPYPGGEIIEDHLWAAHQGKYRITRGGSFSRYGDLARCARRHGRFPEEIYAVGFRLAESAEP
jgi:formylglycine-generating enzyme required for sulfatase activity